MKRFFVKYADEVLLLAGCGCILTGLAHWNIPITWIAGGLMFIGWGVLIGKARARK